ncbi:Zn(II)2Cys6 transcription factor domain-containing protein [Aspergillus undulatus]|uniref:Zn(II)2Cys6 transcription factor domain-containing protein n=1 Tax=Aspergillus undulatus TaxID=1810928 RepID=UPI003CCD0785
MPSRRPHTKSRSGCQRCKEKHIKCDEAQPACSACVRYNVPCIPKLPRRSRPAPGSSGQSSQVDSPAPSPSVASPRSRSSVTIWEFELLHHWIIREAIRHDFFMHMVLVLSALHLALTKDPLFTESHRAFILEGCSGATTRFREEAENTNELNCHAVQAFPSLVTIYAFSLAQLDRGSMSEEAVLDEMIGIMVLVKGHVLVENTTQRLITLQGDDWVQNEDFIGDQANSSGDSLAVKASNTEAVHAFIKVLKLNLHPNMKPLAFPCDVKSDYLELLRQRNPMALVILAHYTVILGKCSSQWWCSNWGVQLLSVIAAILPAAYREAIIWPLQMLNLGNGAGVASPRGGERVQ